MRTSITLAILLALSLGANAQEISGTVTDKRTKEPVVNASVSVTQGSIVKGGTITDFDGKYSIKPLDTGFYEVAVSYLGYQTTKQVKVHVTAGTTTGVNFALEPESGKTTLKCMVVKEYKKPLVDKYKTSTVITPGYQSQRAAGNLYIIDGVQVQGRTGINMAQGATEQIAVLSSGIPANYGDESYKKIEQNDFKNVKSSPVSTMSVDVDRASYTNIRRFINAGQKPPVDAVRVEEMINYFEYNYPQPSGNDPVAFNTQLTTCPWNKDHLILHVGLQARTVNTDALPASNLVFLIDVSGSMDSYDKLPLLQQGLNMLVDKLRAQDKVSLVVYAGNAGLVLPATSGAEKAKIKHAINALSAGGSTAGGAGIQLAYNIARNNFVKDGNNRVILCTDGDFNVGVSSNNELEDMIVKERASGVFLTCLGFGTGNYQDDRMEMLADKGNGNYNYIDNLDEAHKTLVSEFGGTIFTVAKDVKCQVEFNPVAVSSYRLIGYENRLLNTEDFKDDKKDAGDMGSGHTVTVMYEIVPAGSLHDENRPVDELRYQYAMTTAATGNNELATIKLRYKQPADSVSKQMDHIIANNVIPFAVAGDNVRFASAVAMFGMLLREDKKAGSANYNDVLAIVNSGKKEDKYRKEFAELVKAQAALVGKLSAK